MKLQLLAAAAAALFAPLASAQSVSLRLRSNIPGAGSLFLTELLAWSEQGQNVLLGRPVNMTGGTLATGTLAAVTDGFSDGMGDVGCRVNFVAGTTAVLTIPFAAPANISTVIFVNKGQYGSTWATNAVLTYNAGGTLELLDASGTVTWTQPLGVPGDQAMIKTFQPGLPVTLAPPPTGQSAEDITNGVRFIQMNPASTFIYVREVIAYDANGFNVAFGKPVGNGSVAASLGAPATAYLTDLVIEGQGIGGFTGTIAAPGNMWQNAANSANGFWRIDLGAAYRIARIVVFYWNCVACEANSVSASTRNNGARLRLLNGANAELLPLTGQASVASFGINCITVNVASVVTPSFTPSNTATPSNTPTGSLTATPSNTPSPSTTPSWTASNTATPTPSLPEGLSPSVTSSVTASPSNTGTSTGSNTISPTSTPTATLTPSATPIFAVGVRVRSTLPAGFIALAELMAFDINGVLLTASESASGRPAFAAPVANASSSMPGFGPELGNDLNAETYYTTAWFQSAPVNASSAPVQWYQIMFPRPAQVARVYVHQKKGTTLTFVNAMVAAGATVELLSLSGGVMASRSVASTGHIVTAVFADYAPALAQATPDARSPATASPEEAAQMVRYVYVSCVASLLSIRELMVLDYNNNNVALRKAATARSGFGAANGPELAVDGVISDDITEVSTYVSGSCGSTPSGTWWELDLGGLFWVRSLIFYQRLASDGIGAGTYNRNNGVPITLLNNAREPVLTAPLVITNLGGPVQTFVVGVAPPSPSMTASVSSTASTSLTASNTPTASLTVGALPSPTSTTTRTRSPSPSSSLSSSPSVTATNSRAPPATTAAYAIRIIGNSSLVPLSVVELMAFSPSGQLLVGSGALSGQGGDAVLNAPSTALDLDASPTSPNFALTAVGTAEPASFTLTLANPSLVSRVVFVQRKGTFSATNVYSFAAANTFTFSAPALNLQCQLLTAVGDVLETRPCNRQTNIQTVTFSPPSTAPFVPASAPTDVARRSFVRYIRMHCWFSLLAIRELMVFDADGRNMALGKAAWANSLPSGAVANLVPSGAVDGFIEGDSSTFGNETGAFLSNACPVPLGQGASVVFWQVDLGYPVDVKSLVFWNRHPVTGSNGDYQRVIGSPFVFLNHFNDTLTGATINGVAPDPAVQVNQYILGAAFNLPGAAFAQTFTVDLSTVTVPSSTATPSQTPSNTASLSVGWVSASATLSSSGTPSNTASLTNSATATLSVGALPSSTGTSEPTPSTSSTGSVSGSVAPTPTQTPSVSASPGVASAVRITIGAGQCLSLYEVVVVSPTGQILTTDATATATSVLNGDVDAFGPANAIDLSMTDPTATGIALTTAGTNSKPFATGCGLTDSLTITFAPRFAGSIVDKVYVVNDASSTVAANRAVVGGAQVQLLSAGGQVYASQLLTAATVQTFSFYTGAAQVPWVPASASSGSDAILSNLVRYLRIVGPNPATGGVPLRLREVWAIDGSGVIVSAGKDAIEGSSSASGIAGLNWTAASCVNGVIDFDAGAGGDLCSTGGTDRFIPGFGAFPLNNTNWWEVDLGGSFNVTTLVIFNRAGATFQTQIANGQTLLLNSYRAVIGEAAGRALTTAPIQTLRYRLFAPTGSPTASPPASITPSGTASISSTRTGTPSTSGTRTGTASTSGTRTGTASTSVTPSGTGSASNTPSTTGSSSATRTRSRTPSESGTPSGTRSAAVTPSGSRTVTPPVTRSATASVSATSSETASISASQTGTASPSSSSAATSTASVSASAAATASASLTPRPSQSSSKSVVPTATRTRTRSATRTRTRSATKTKTKTKTKTRTPSRKRKLL